MIGLAADPFMVIDLTSKAQDDETVYQILRYEIKLGLVRPLAGTGPNVAHSQDVTGIARKNTCERCAFASPVPRTFEVRG